MQGKGSAIEAGVSTTIFPPIKWVSWSLIVLQKAQAVLLAFGLQDHGSCWVKVQTCSFTSQGLDVLIHKAISTWFIAKFSVQIHRDRFRTGPDTKRTWCRCWWSKIYFCVLVTDLVMGTKLSGKRKSEEKSVHFTSSHSCLAWKSWRLGMAWWQVLVGWPVLYQEVWLQLLEPQPERYKPPALLLRPYQRWLFAGKVPWPCKTAPPPGGSGVQTHESGGSFSHANCTVSF